MYSDYLSSRTGSISSVSSVGHAAAAVARLPGTREQLDFLASELEVLEKTVHELQAKLDIFLDPPTPEAVQFPEEMKEPASELNNRIRQQARHAMMIRSRVAGLTERIN